MSLVEALKLALNKEKASIELYNRLANEHRDIRELLFSLVIEEEKHKRLIEAKMAEITKY